MTDETIKIREEIGRKETSWAAQEIAWLRRKVASLVQPGIDHLRHPDPVDNRMLYLAPQDRGTAPPMCDTGDCGGARR